jgi:hypothetical protein
MGVSRYDEIDRIVGESGVECWLVFEEDSGLGGVERECIEIFSQTLHCLSIVIGHSGEYHTIDLDFFIVDDYDVLISFSERALEIFCWRFSMEGIDRILDTLDDLLGVSVFLVVAIREVDSMRRLDMLELSDDTRIVDEWSIEKISRNQYYLRIQCIDTIHECTSLRDPIDVTIVSIGDHDDSFSMPSMVFIYLYLVCCNP